MHAVNTKIWTKHKFIRTQTESHTSTQTQFCNSAIQPLSQWQAFHPYFTPLKPIPHDILQSRLSNNSHSLYTLVLQYLTLPWVRAPSPNPT